MAHRVAVPQRDGEITITKYALGVTSEHSFKVHDGHIEVASVDLPTVLRHVDGAHEVKAQASAK